MFARPTRTRLAAVVVVAAISIMLPHASASTLPLGGRPVVGVDISWPNCPIGMGIPQRPTEGRPMPAASAGFAIVGLTNGPGFFPNPCLASQVATLKARHLWTGVYAISSYPTATQLATFGGAASAPLVTRLYRSGVAQARFNLATMHAAGLPTVPMVWVDVEPVRGWDWSRSTTNNRAVVRGVLAGYQSVGLRVGLYSYRYGWNQITGGLRLPGVPTWVPLSTCTTPSFSGGPVWLTQTTHDYVDVNTTCPILNGTTAHPSPLTPYLSTRLALGARGPAVVALQQRLGRTADGAFGPITRSHVIAVQRAHAIPTTGVVATTTWRALGAGTIIPGQPPRMRFLFATT